MAIYPYLCPRCGPFDLEREMGTATVTARCVTCGSHARRAWSPPNLNRTPRPLADALTRAERSREQPEVVTRIPPRSGASTPTPQVAPATPLPRW